MNPSTPSATSPAADRDTSAANGVLRFDPAPSQWRTSPPPRRDERTWRELSELALRWSHLTGVAPLVQRKLLIATGHQAWLWHAGILAKDIAASVYASQRGASWLHLTVDHDVSDAAAVPVPLRDGDALTVATLTLGRTLANVPTGSQPVMATDEVLSNIDAFAQRHAGRLMVDLHVLRDAVRNAGNARTLAQQMTAMHARVMQPLVGDMPVIGSADLFELTAARAMLDDMLADPRGCATAYNTAVRMHPNAGIAPLHVGYELVELPLWLVAWQQPRQRVYVSLAGSRADLVTGDGEVVALDDGATKLAPKALMLTAVMRSIVSDLFIHGAGGGVYDRVMENWLRAWRGDTVAPMAVASADLRLAANVTTSTAEDLTRAVWYAHHLPHNVDRQLSTQPSDEPLVEEKRDLLRHMEDDREHQRRFRAFQRVHAINESLVARHHDAVTEAVKQVALTQQGVANRAVLQRRDWPLQWHTQDALRKLHSAIVSSL